MDPDIVYADPVVTSRTVLRGGLQSQVHSTPAPHTRADGPVFVLLHGIGMSHRYYRRLQGLLSAHGGTHSLDLPGFGATATPGRQISVAEYAAVIGDILDGLATGPVVVIGHSMGTQFAVELALRRPELVSHLVLLGPVVDSRHRTVLRQALALGLDCLLESPSGNAMVFTDYLRAGPRWYQTELPVMMNYDIETRLKNVVHPVLIVRGSRDPVAGNTWCRTLAGTARNGTFLEVPSKPHIVQHGAAEEITAAILELIHGRHRI